MTQNKMTQDRLLRDIQKPFKREKYTDLKDCIDRNIEVIYRYIIFTRKINEIGNKLGKDLVRFNRKNFDKSLDKAMREALDVKETSEEKEKASTLINDQEITEPSFSDSSEDDEMSEITNADNNVERGKTKSLQEEDEEEMIYSNSDSDSDVVETVEKCKRSISPVV